MAYDNAIQLKRWSRGLSVMLEKTIRVTLVTKLCAILLMEADFNTTNKIIYGNRMMEKAQKYNLMPEEIFSEHNRMADDGTLSKTLFCNLARQARVPAAIASVNASNCYDRIAHAIASLVFQAFGVPHTAAESMLGTIENMKFFLRTGFGDSTSFAGGGIKLGKFSWKKADAGLIDGLLVNGSATLVDRVAGIVRQLQTGRLYNYAFAMILGLIVLLAVLVKVVGA